MSTEALQQIIDEVKVDILSQAHGIDNVFKRREIARTFICMCSMSPCHRSWLKLGLQLILWLVLLSAIISNHWDLTSISFSSSSGRNVCLCSKCNVGWRRLLWAVDSVGLLSPLRIWLWIQSPQSIRKPHRMSYWEGGCFIHAIWNSI